MVTAERKDLRSRLFLPTYLPWRCLQGTWHICLFSYREVSAHQVTLKEAASEPVVYLEAFPRCCWLLLNQFTGCHALTSL